MDAITRGRRTLAYVMGVQLVGPTTPRIRNNINCRVCGRADNVLSQIILDNTDAADQIPKDAKGRFLLHDGTVFQGYWLDEGIL